MANIAARATEEEVDDDDGASSSGVSEGEYIVEGLMGKKIENGKEMYKVRWKGFEPHDDTWEPRDNLDCPELLAAFEAKEARTKAHKEERASTPQSISNGKKRKHSKGDSDSSDDDQSALKALKIVANSKDAEKEKKKKGRPSKLADKFQRSSLGGASASGSGSISKPGANLKKNMDAFKKKSHPASTNSRASSVDSSSNPAPSQKTQWGPKSAHKPVVPIPPKPVTGPSLLKGLKFKKHEEVVAAITQGEGERDGDASRASSASLGGPVASGSGALAPQPKPKQRRKPKITIAADDDQDEAELYSEDSMHPDYEVPVSKNGSRTGKDQKQGEPAPPIADPSTSAATTTQSFVGLVVDSPSGRSKVPAQSKDDMEADDEEEEDDEVSEAVHARLTSNTPSPSKSKVKAKASTSHASPLGKVLSAQQAVPSPSPSSSTPYSLPIDLKAKRESPIQGPFSKIFGAAPSLLGGGDRKGASGSTLPPPTSSPAIASDPRVKAEVKKEGSSLLTASGIKSAIANALPGSSSSRNSSSDEKKAARVANSSADLEKKLRKSDFYQKHRKVFEGKDAKNLAAACAEVLKIDGDLILSLKGRRCAITTAANGAYSPTHDAENWALGILLLKVGAELPKSVADIEVVFMHRQHTFVQLASSLVDLTTRSGPYVHFYEFGLDKKVGILLPAGWAVLPTLSALQSDADVSAMLLNQKRYPGLKVAIHPATVCLARSRSNRALTDAVLGLIERSNLALLKSDDLPKESRWASVSPHEVLSGKNIPEVTIESEFSDIETTLYHLRETQRDKYRRFVLLSERNVDVLREKCLKVGVQMTSWADLEATITTNIF